MISLKPLFGYLAYHRISLKTLSEKTGISYTTLSKMRKTNDFTTSSIDRICLCLNLNISDIMRYED